MDTHLAESTPQGMCPIPIPAQIWKFGVFSVWDQLNATLTNLPAPFIDICSQSILTNLGLVWTVLLSAMWLGTRYDQVHACYVIQGPDARNATITFARVYMCLFMVWYNIGWSMVQDYMLG